MEKTGFLGIDVSKGYADFILLGNSGAVLEEGFQLTDSKEGRQKLKELIGNWQSLGLQELYCGVESTGGYENNWYHFFKEAFKGCGIYVCRINPRAVKAISDASLKRTITDAVSAENIASYMIGFPQKLDYGLKEAFGNDSFKEGRMHLTCIKMQQKQKVQLGNQLEKLLYQYFAEMLVYCRHGMPVWLLSLLAKYPTAAAVAKAGVAKLSAIKSISEEKAASVISKAKDNIRAVSPQISHVIMLTAKEMLHKEALIKEEKQYLASLYEGSEEVKLLCSIPGVGVGSAVAIMLEIEDVRKFSSAKKMAAYFGVHPTFKQSGDNTWGNHMSKAGRGEIRAVLYMVALGGARYNPLLKQSYAKARANGMKHGQAAGVVMHKALRIIYGVLKSKVAFNIAVDEQHQQKAIEKQRNNEAENKASKKIKQQKKHRFQTISINAPISGKAERRIKKQIVSQTSS
jgi:transposase